MAGLAVFPIVAYGLGAGVVGSAIGSFFGHIFGKRDVDATIPGLVYFHNNNFTAADMAVLNGMALHGSKNNEIIFRNGELSGWGEMSQKSYANGIDHGKLTVSWENEGENRTKHGHWVAVDTGKHSKANVETIGAFEELHKILGPVEDTAEDVALRVIRLLDVVTADIH